VIALALTISAVLLVLATLVSPKATSELGIASPFECGFLNKESRRTMFSMHFFIVALLFIVFDVELVIIFPYMQNLLLSTGSSELAALVAFTVLAVVGLIVEWANTILEWAIFG